MYKRQELSVRAAAAGETGLLMQLTATGAVSAESRVTFRHISQLEAEEPKEKANETTLLLRYIEEEQQLWEIAKQCGTTLDAIRQANDLPADTAQAVSYTHLDVYKRQCLC